MKKIILASGSPRRKEILQNLNLNFEIIVPDIDETIYSAYSPEEYINKLSKEKGEFVYNKITDDCLIISADTIVLSENKILGKPKDESTATEMLSRLSGKSHEVMTSLSLLNCDKQGFEALTKTEITKVYFKKLTDTEIQNYIKTGEPFDKAGAYGIQGIGAFMVERIEGDYFNVVGLPIHLLYILFSNFGYNIFEFSKDIRKSKIIP